MKKLINIIILILLSKNIVFAQKKEADEKYKTYEYAKAIPLYEKYLKDNATDYDAYSNLANSYKIINNVNKAVESYKAISQLSNNKPEDLFSLIQLLMIQGNLDEAKGFLNSYKTRAPGDKAEYLSKSLEGYSGFKNASTYQVVNKTGDYNYSVFGAYQYNNSLFVTAENTNSKDNTFTGRNYTDIYTTDADFSKLKPFAANIMSAKDDGVPTFTDGGNTMYFTRVNKDGVNENNITTRKLHIVISHLQDGKWSEPQPFMYNNNSYNTAHATISKDGNYLVFSSDKAGGKGGMDLYVCKKNGDTWSDPQNLSVLNSWGNELFPSFDDNNNLVFASNGLPGLGGLDLFSSTFNNGNLGSPVNMKAPLNSSYDDFCYSSVDGANTGYISSNRYDVKTDDVLYFEKTKKAVPPPPPPPTPVVANHTIGLKIKVVDKYTKTPLPYVSVSVKDKNGELVQKGMTDEKGMIEIPELATGNYTIQGMLNDVTTTIAKVTPDEFNTSNGFIEKQVEHNDPRFTLKGIVTNSTTGKPVEGVTVVNANQSLGGTRQIITGANGEFFFQLEQNSDFRVNGRKAKWLSSETADVTTKGLDRTTELYVKLTLNMQEPKANDVIKLKKIFYAYDKCDIRPVAAAELDRLIALMNDYKDMTIELSSHTDSRGSDEYNMKLSQCRADAAVNYILGKGMDKTRIVAKGYGETRLVNECKNGVNCTDIKHEENRRTEFKIITCPSCPRVEN